MSEKVNVDLVGKDGGVGDVAAKLLSMGKLDPGRMRPYIASDGKSYVTIYKGGDPTKEESYDVVEVQTNATLRRDEWKQLDEAVLRVAEQRLVGIQDLVNRNLVFNLGNAMGTTVLEYHSLSDALEAELTMDGVTRAKGDRPLYSTSYLPLPIIHVDYEINARVLAASRNLGNPLDTTMAERAARKVSEKLEAMLFTDTTYTFGGGTIYSYLNHPSVIPATLATSWADSSITGEDIINDVLAMKQLSINNLHYGPWVLYVPTAYETVLDADYNATAKVTIRERVLKIAGIEAVQVADMLPADHVLLVQMTSDVVRLVRGMPIQNVEWSTEGNMVTKFKVLTIQVPQIRADYNSKTGIVLLS